jgi:hypothetical protein
MPCFSFHQVPETVAPLKSRKILCVEEGRLCSAKVWLSGYDAVGAPATVPAVPVLYSASAFST